MQVVQGVETAQSRGEVIPVIKLDYHSRYFSAIRHHISFMRGRACCLPMYLELNLFSVACSVYFETRHHKTHEVEVF